MRTSTNENIAFTWFMDFGMLQHDERTVSNILMPSFIEHAKSGATDIEREYIDRCVEFQKTEVAA